MANLAVSNLNTIYPKIKTRIYSFKKQVCIFFGQIFINIIIPDVNTCRVFIRYIGGIAGIWVINVCIVGSVKTMHLPIGWNRNTIVVIADEVFLIKPVFYLINAWIILKIPDSVKRLIITGLATNTFKCVVIRLIGYKISPWFFAINMQYRKAPPSIFLQVAIKTPPKLKL